MDEDKVLEVGIQGVKDASSRSRIAFVMAVFTCGAILTTLYNNYFAWNRIAVAPNRGLMEWPQPNAVGAEIRDPNPTHGLKPAELQKWQDDLSDIKKSRQTEALTLLLESRKESAKEVEENEGINVPLLGIRLSSGDLDLFGSLGVFCFSTYYLLCVRRMSLEMESLYRESNGLNLIQRRYIYAGVRQSYVLNTTVEDDIVQDGQSEVEALARSELALHFYSWLFPKVTFLPFLTVALMVFGDWWYFSVEIRRVYGSSV